MQATRVPVLRGALTKQLASSVRSQRVREPLVDSTSTLLLVALPLPKATLVVFVVSPTSKKEA